MKKEFYATFGCGQVNQGSTQKIIAENINEAREVMFEFYGDKWAFVYSSLEEIHEMDKKVILPTLVGGCL